MGSKMLILLGLAIVVLVIIIYAVAKKPKWAHGGYWRAHLLEDADQIYRRSSGVYDEEAALALQRTLDREDPTPADHLRAATIITRNILAQDHRPEVQADGNVAPEAVRHSQLRRELFDQARGHYQAALETFTPEEIAQELAQELVEPPPADNYPPRQPGIEFIIEAARDFAFGGFDTLLVNDPLLAVLFTEGDMIQFFPAEILDVELAGLAEQRRTETVQQRQAMARDAAQAQGGARGAATETYVRLATRNTDSPENSHDSAVVACLRKIVTLLREQQTNIRLPALNEIVQDIRSNGAAFSLDPRSKEPRAEMVRDVIEVINRTRDGERNTAIDITDEEALRRVWARADDPKNTANRDKLRQAAFDALFDCWKTTMRGREIVCVSGRTGRLLGALSLLDYDPRLWEVRMLEQYKNDIFERAGALVRERAQRWADSADAEQRKVGLSYLATTAAEMRSVGEVSEEHEARFKEEARARIGSMVDGYVRDVDGAIPPHSVEAIKSEALAAVS